jgi:type II secretion system protein H
MKRPTRSQGGFTLVELFVGLALIAIMAAIAAPSMNKALPRIKLRRAAYQLTNDLQLARLKCISSNQQARILFNTGNDTYTRYLDADRDGLFEAGEEDIVNRTMPNGVSFVVASTAANVTFDPTGTANDGTGAAGDIPVTLANTATPPESRQITVNRAMGVVKLN